MAGDDYLRADCNGGIIPARLVDYHDAMQRAHRAAAAWLDDPRARRRMHREDVTVRALVTYAATLGDEEHAAFLPNEYRHDADDEAERIAREHGFSPDRLIALRGLARSRGVALDVVLRAALRGELRAVVTLPAVRTVASAEKDERGSNKKRSHDDSRRR